MERLEYKSVHDFCESVIATNNAINDDDEGKWNDIGIVAKYGEAKKIIESLIRGGLETGMIKLYDAEYNKYKDEFIIEICGNNISVQPMKYKDNYLRIEDDVVYLLDNCSSSVVKYINSEIIIEVGIVSKEKGVVAKDAKDNKNPKDDKDGKAKVKKSSMYIINGKEVDREVYKEAVKEIEKHFSDWDDHFTDVIQDSLLSLCRFRDISNQLLADFHKYLL